MTYVAHPQARAWFTRAVRQPKKLRLTWQCSQMKQAYRSGACTACRRTPVACLQACKTHERQEAATKLRIIPVEQL